MSKDRFLTEKVEFLWILSRTASQKREFLKKKSPDNLLNNMEFAQTHVSAVQREKDITKSSSVKLSVQPKDNGSSAMQELQALWQKFTSWLQPEKQSKEQMISQLVLEQFLKIGHCKDKFALNEQWESSGRNIGRFMEVLTDECLRPLVMVHVYMQGQEALFSENMSLKEVINILKEQQSGSSLSQGNTRTSLPIIKDMLLATGHKKRIFGQKWPSNNIEVNGCVNNLENEMDALFLTQKEQVSEPIEVDASDGIPLNYSRTGQVSSRYKEISHRSNSSVHVPKEEKQQEITSRSEQSEHFQNQNSNFKFEGHQERPNRKGKTYKCDECPKTFKYSSMLLRHQTVHRKKGSFFCTVCYTSFYNHSEMQAHEIIHKENKVKTCNTWRKTFGYKTNLQAHERIHTGEKPYKYTLRDRGFQKYTHTNVT